MADSQRVRLAGELWRILIARPLSPSRHFSASLGLLEHPHEVSPRELMNLALAPAAVAEAVEDGGEGPAAGDAAGQVGDAVEIGPEGHGFLAGDGDHVVQLVAEGIDVRLGGPHQGVNLTGSAPHL